jgi:hypothetical protein
MSSRQQQVGVVLAVAALVMCAGVAVAQRGPAASIATIINSAACKMVDKNVVSACFDSMSAGKKNAMANRVVSG